MIFIQGLPVPSKASSHESWPRLGGWYDAALGRWCHFRQYQSGRVDRWTSEEMTGPWQPREEPFAGEEAWLGVAAWERRS